jgi:hypothetical protein
VFLASVLRKSSRSAIAWASETTASRGSSRHEFGGPGRRAHLAGAHQRVEQFARVQRISGRQRQMLGQPLPGHEAEPLLREPGHVRGPQPFEIDHLAAVLPQLVPQSVELGRLRHRSAGSDQQQGQLRDGPG